MGFIVIFLFIFIKTYFQPLAIVVPHHNVVKDLRLSYLKKISNQRFKTDTIIIIGPDHFSPYQYDLSYNNQNWSLFNGQLNFATYLESDLKPFLNLRNSIVKNDHAVYNLISGIKSAFPRASIFPILIGQQVPKDRLEPLLATISQNCHSNCLLLASVDFSHYLPYVLADIHDIKSINVLANQDLDQIFNLEVDSQQSLYILSKFSQIKKAHHFNLFSHTNSTKIQNLPDTESTSHIMASYSPGLKTKTKPNPTFLYSQSSPLDRYDYGADQTNTTLTQTVEQDNLIIIPSATSSVDFIDNKIIINLGPELFVAGDSNHLVIYPPGKLLQSFRCPYCQVNIDRGTINYD